MGLPRIRDEDESSIQFVDKGAICDRRRKAGDAFKVVSMVHVWKTETGTKVNLQQKEQR